MQTNLSQTQHQKPIRLLQITDSHLFACTDQSLLGINTYESFHAVIHEISQSEMAFDYVLLTGDLSQDQSVESYQHLADTFADWSIPCLWFAGNHDNVENMHQAMSVAPFNAAKHVLLENNWQLVILDSQVKGKPYGFVSKEQLSFAQDILSTHSQNALLILHHHPVLSGSQWLDAHCLHNHQEFWQKVKPFSQVKAVVTGHIHQEFEEEYQGCQVLACPSTCVQFLPKSTEFALDSNAPGWREILLYPDGKIETKVYRLSQNRFIPDMDSPGY